MVEAPGVPRSSSAARLSEDDGVGRVGGDDGRGKLVDEGLDLGLLRGELAVSVADLGVGEVDAVLELGVEASVLEEEGGLLGDGGEEVLVLGVEGPAAILVHGLEDADDLAAETHRDAQDVAGRTPDGGGDIVGVAGVIGDVVGDDGLARLGDAAGKAVAEGDEDILETVGVGTEGDLEAQDPRRAVEEHHRGGIGPELGADPAHDGTEKLAAVEPDAEEVAEMLDGLEAGVEADGVVGAATFGGGAGEGDVADRREGNGEQRAEDRDEDAVVESEGQTDGCRGDEAGIRQHGRGEVKPEREEHGEQRERKGEAPRHDSRDLRKSGRTRLTGRAARAEEQAGQAGVERRNGPGEEGRSGRGQQCEDEGPGKHGAGILGHKAKRWKATGRG